jgi:RecJ-like exonuclease
MRSLHEQIRDAEDRLLDDSGPHLVSCVFCDGSGKILPALKCAACEGYGETTRQRLERLEEDEVLEASREGILLD